MDLKRVRNLRLLLTAHFAIIAWLTAMLVATGSGTFFLPAFIFFVSVIAFIFVDVLESFELKSITSAIGMSTATAIAVGTYVYSVISNSESGQLLAIAGLLVYPEAVLFLQRKNLRIFEQLAIFLLLEMIVAALVNDNILFGLLLAPIMMLWVSSLFLFSRYTTLVKIDPSIEKQNPRLAELLYQRFVKSVWSKESAPVVTSNFIANKGVQSSNTWRRTLQSIPLGLGALFFAGLFFYLVPRTNSASFGTSVQTTTTAIGLPDQLTFGSVGRVLQNPAQVMRASFVDPVENTPVRPKLPPYFRAKVFERYGPGPGRRSKRGEWDTSGSLRTRELKKPEFINSLGQRVKAEDERNRMRENGRQIVRAEFTLRPEAATELFTLPPAFSAGKKQDLPLRYDDKQMVLQKLDSTGLERKKSLIYSLDSAAFQDGEQTRVTPAVMSRYPDRVASEAGELIFRLTQGFSRFPQADAYRRAILAREGLTEDRRLGTALAFENHLAFSGEFSYSLDLRPPTDAAVDPVEDFIVYQRVGHCQYFATAMVCMLRQSGIPARVVVGYRPTEYNTYGDYFLVRQLDAHAWVEALFSRTDLENSIFQSQLTEKDNWYWVRFDPTPPPDGALEITEQDGQAIDYAEKLWQEYVVEGQKLSTENSIYAPVESKETYAKLVQALAQFKEDLFSGSIFRGEIGFAWPIAILVIGLGTLALLVWQFLKWLPRVSPRLAKRLGVAKTDLELKYPFYARCMKILSKIGLRRGQSVTPKELTDRASGVLQDKGQDADESLDLLTKTYYRLRFAGDGLADAEQKIFGADRERVEKELARLETAVQAARKS